MIACKNGVTFGLRRFAVPEKVQRVRLVPALAREVDVEIMRVPHHSEMGSRRQTTLANIAFGDFVCYTEAERK